MHLHSDRSMEPYAAALFEAVDQVLAGWLATSVISTAIRITGDCEPELHRLAHQMAAQAHPIVLEELRLVLSADVDHQRSNPLAILRRAIRFPTNVLLQCNVPPPTRPVFEAEHFPEDLYSLGPANWSDVSESLSEPGLVWGAWKAKTILDRRRSAGLR